MARGSVKESERRLKEGFERALKGISSFAGKHLSVLATGIIGIRIEKETDKKTSK